MWIKQYFAILVLFIGGMTSATLAKVSEIHTLSTSEQLRYRRTLKRLIAFVWKQLRGISSYYGEQQLEYNSLLHGFVAYYEKNILMYIG